jgi:endonuclease G
VLSARLFAALSFVALASCVPDRLREERGPAARGAHRSAASAAPRPIADRRPAEPPPSSANASTHLALGTPRDADPSDDLLLTKPEYALSYNGRRNVANWVGWRLVASDFGPTPRHRGKFIADDSLPHGFYRVTHEDYVGSGFDRGHMCRSEDRTSSVEANRATFLLTNVLPQRHELNAGPWLRLEEQCQELAQREHKELFIASGPIFEGPPATIGHGVAVPPAFFKIVVVLEPGQGAADVSERTRVIAVVMPNQADLEHEGWARFRTSVDAIEARTGYDFLTAVPEAIQRVIEARVDDGPGR